MFKTIREPFNAISHFVAALAALCGTFYLIVRGWKEPKLMWVFILYGLCMVLLFLASAIYHSSLAAEARMQKLRKLDHAAIYLLIAGTYTPICYYFFRGFWQWGMLAIIWSLAAAGIIVKLFIIRAPRWLTAGVYLLMGWLCVMAAEEIVRSMPPGAIAWLLAGGLFYTFGAVIYITKRWDFKPGVFGFHEIWHIFVILGAFSHFTVIAKYITP